MNNLQRTIYALEEQIEALHAQASKVNEGETWPERNRIREIRSEQHKAKENLRMIVHNLKETQNEMTEAIKSVAHFTQNANDQLLTKTKTERIKKFWSELTTEAIERIEELVG